jgi:hypothetical protein
MGRPEAGGPLQGRVDHDLEGIRRGLSVDLLHGASTYPGLRLAAPTGTLVWP